MKCKYIKIRKIGYGAYGDVFLVKNNNDKINSNSNFFALK